MVIPNAMNSLTNWLNMTKKKKKSERDGQGTSDDDDDDNDDNDYAASSHAYSDHRIVQPATFSPSQKYIMSVKSTWLTGWLAAILRRLFLTLSFSPD